jgi:carboxyl-terminal processing protease
LDLRSATGDSLTEVINLVGLFIDHGPIIQVKDANGNVQQYEDVERGSVWGGPLVVLTSKFTSGAGESIAATIQDYQRGIVIGDATTSGKGTVQSLMELSQKLFPRVQGAPNLGALLLTTQQTFRLNGQSIQQRGVAADIALPSLTNEMNIGEEHLEYAISYDTVAASTISKLGMAKDEVVAQLKENSLSRIADSPDFQNVAKSIRRYRARNARPSVTLDEQGFIEQRRQDQLARQDDAQEDELEAPGPAYYVREVIQIALDYVAALEE